MLQQTNEGILLKVKIIPKASRSEIVGWENGELKIRIAAIPEKGEANIELVRFLSKQLGIGKSKIELVKGQTSRHKCLCLKGVTLKEVSFANLK